MRTGRFFQLLVLVAIVIVAGFATGTGARPAQAQQPGGATNLAVFNQRCVSAGVVEVIFTWSPSRLGTQWFDISRTSNFVGFANQGPLSPTMATSVWQLSSETNYFARVATFTAQGVRNSATLAFRTASCGFTPPHSISSTVFDDFVRINWQRGSGNLFFCVDTAFTQSDLVNVRGSWRNWGCGTTATQLDLTQLACDRVHFYRVWAAGAGTSGHSQIGSFVSQDCDFTAPTNPRASIQSSTSVLFRWDRGSDNLFFCVDLALSQDDLVDLEDSWFNAACGTTGTSALVSGLDCGTQYFYRIWAAGTSTSGYTGIATVTTPPCDFEPPDDLEAEVVGDQVVFSWDEEDPAFWFCVDTAQSQSDLLNFTGTWENWDCGDTDDTASVDADMFECDETYFWRVFAFAGNVSGHSEIETFEVPCP